MVQYNNIMLAGSVWGSILIFNYWASFHLVLWH